MKLEYSEAADLTTRNIKRFYSGLRKLILHGINFGTAAINEDH